MVSVAAVVRC